MSFRMVLCAAWLLSGALAASSREVTDTLVSTKNDRVIITYDVSQSGGKVVVRFMDARKKLGRTSAGRYKRLNEVAVVFFDRTGNYPDMTFSGISTEAFMVPANMSYRYSSDGYFLLNDQPTVTMDVKSGSASPLSIPIYLAHYDKKGHYTVFSRCGDLTVRPPRKRAAAASEQKVTQVTSQTITSQEELESGFTDADEANILLGKVSDLLEEQEEYPFSDELKQAISSLRDRSYRITDPRLSARISDVLAACRQKEDGLKGDAQAADEAAAMAAEQKEKEALAQAQARQDSIAAAQQRQAEKDRKRNIWMVIGGLVLAALAFVGNQTFQHVRNMKNQKSLMDMQASVVKRAENEAKRRARSMARNQVHKMESQARTKARKTVNSQIGKITKGKNKGISI